MLGVSHSVEVLLIVLCLLVVYSSILRSTAVSCIFNTVVVVACVIFIHGFSPCRGLDLSFLLSIFVCIYMF